MIAKKRTTYVGTALGLLTGLMLVGSAMQAFSQPAPHAQEEVALVRARVKEVRRERGVTVGVMEVIKVYAGPERWIGKTFVQDSVSEGSVFAAMETPAFDRGEIGIWTLRETEEGLVLALHRHLPILGVRQKWNRDFSMYEALGETMEEISRVEKSARVELLKKHATNQNQFISRWAIGMLGDSKPEESKSGLTNSLPTVRFQFSVNSPLIAHFLSTEVRRGRRRKLASSSGKSGCRGN